MCNEWGAIDVIIATTRSESNRTRPECDTLLAVRRDSQSYKKAATTPSIVGCEDFREDGVRPV
jgi:hypothetical protein